jgi:hypothetical protein
MSSREVKYRIITGWRVAAHVAIRADRRFVVLSHWVENWPSCSVVSLPDTMLSGEVVTVDKVGERYRVAAQYEAGAVAEWCDRWLSEEGGV